MVEKMKKSLLWCLVCLVCLIPCSGAALAAEADAAQDAADGYVYDAAGLLTADEISDLNDEIASFMEESGWNVYAVTTDDAQGKSATAYADDFFDEHSTEQEDGVVLLIDMDNREITISTCGIAIRYLTDSRIDNILDAAYAKISNGDYNGCMHSMLTGVENYYEKGISEGQYNYDSETGKISRYHVLTLGEIFGVLAVAIGAGCIIYFTISNSYKVRGKGYYYAYQQNSKVTAGEIWSRNLKEIQKLLFLTKKEQQDLEEFGQLLGRMDMPMQLSAIQFYQEKIMLSLAEAKAAADSRQKLYRYLGALGGAALVLVIM